MRKTKKVIALIILINLCFLKSSIVSAAIIEEINAKTTEDMKQEETMKLEESSIEEEIENTNSKVETEDVDDAIPSKDTDIEVQTMQLEDTNATKIEVTYEHKPETNTVIATITSNKELQNNKSAMWKLSEDKKHYSFEYDGNTDYITTVTDIEGNVIPVNIVVTQIVEMRYEYKPETNTVIATIVSPFELQGNKPSWTFSEDKKHYSFEFGENTTYVTRVTDLAGNVIPVTVNVTQIVEKETNETIVTVEYTHKPETNTVIATIVSNKELQNNKSTMWKLSEDKKHYSFEYDGNTDYITTVTDIEGNVIPVNIVVTQIVEMRYEYKPETNTVIATIVSPFELQGNKPSWTFSEDKKHYSFEFGENTTYVTRVTDLAGNVIPVTVNVTQIVEKETNETIVTVEYTYKPETNTVIATIISNKELQNNKSANWKLSDDKKHYSFEYDGNTDYITTVTDIEGNVIPVHIVVTQIDYSPATITVNYEYKPETNTVIATIVSNRELQKNKSAMWKLSEDKKHYSFEYDGNTDYTTTVTDKYGNVISVQITVTQIDETPATITVEYTHKPETNTVIATIVSNKELQNNKSALWKLSEDKKHYSFEYDGNTNYTTTVTDRYGNVISVQIIVTQIVEVRYEYKPYTNTVIATIEAPFELQDNKPSWTFSEDKRHYSFEFDENTTYITRVTDLAGNVIPVKINVTQVKPTDILLMDESKYPGYRTLLRKLQSKHPNWKFKLKYTGLDWNTAVNNQDVLVNGSPKSLTQYNNQWKVGEEQYGTGWYRASREAIAYMMDPRNSLDESYIFQFQDLTSTVGTYSDIANMIAGTYLTKYTTTTTDSIINIILRSATKYQISPFHIVSRILQEQGRDGGTLNGYNYNGRIVYNLFNIGATGDSDAEIIANGAAYAYNKGWFSPEDSIYRGAEFLVTNYFKRGQSTLYFQKYNVVEVGNFYNHQYMQNIRAANDEGNRTYRTYRDNGLLNCQFEFVIPVYENMPATACPRPIGTL